MNPAEASESKSVGGNMSTHYTYIYIERERERERERAGVSRSPRGRNFETCIVGAPVETHDGG